MKPTGIVRKIDDLGRIVIPMEFRKSLHIKNNEQLEIYTGNDGEIVLKKVEQYYFLDVIKRLREDISQDSDIKNKKEILRSLQEVIEKL